MRDYGRVYSSFWQSPEARGYSETGRLLALYLLTSPHANLIGCFRLPDAYAADDLQWSRERVREGFAELSATGFLTREDGASWVFIHKYLKWNEFENGNVAIAAWKAFDQVPSIPLKAALAGALLEFGKHLKEPFIKALETLREPFVNPEPEPVPEPSLNPSGTGTISAAPAAQDAPVRKKSKATKEPSPTADTWEAYSTAYEARYGAEPVRNATVNAQLAQLVRRLGADESPMVAAWYVGHKNHFYVSAGHSVGMLLHDAEKLRTEWATGHQSAVNVETFKDRDDAKGIARWEEMTGRIHPDNPKNKTVIDITPRMELSA